MTERSLDNPNATASRRNFLKTTGAVTAGAFAGNLLSGPAASAVSANAPFNPATADAMPTRNLGRTGHRVGIFSLGGQAAIEQPQHEAVAVPFIERAIPVAAQNHQNPRRIPQKEAALKLLFLALRQAAKKWTMSIHHWREALNHFTILWPERMPTLERVAS
jgi:hypothetical protein